MPRRLLTVLLGVAALWCTPGFAQVSTTCSTPGSIIGPADVVDTILVPDSVLMTDVNISVDISHTFIGDLQLTAESPALTSVTLHDGSGAAADDMLLPGVEQVVLT